MEEEQQQSNERQRKCFFETGKGSELPTTHCYLTAHTVFTVC